MRDNLKNVVLPSKWEKGAGSRGNSRHLEIKDTKIKYTGARSSRCMNILHTLASSSCMAGLPLMACHQMSCPCPLAGPGSADKDAASVRTDVCVPPALPVYYFEVEVVSKGREGYIGVGFCTADVNMDRLPGWEPQSYGYHGDDGNAFRSDGKGRKYGPQFETGTFLSSFAVV